MNYTQLLDAVKAEVQNYEDDFVANLPVMVQTAEQRVFNAVQLPVQRKNVTGSLSAFNPYLTLPADFLSPYSLAVQLPDGGYAYLLNKDVEYIREAYPAPGSTGTPKVYALFDEDTTIVGPTPAENLDVELHYNAYPASITTAGNSWLGDNFDSVLLYGTLVEAAVFMKEEADMMAAYEKRFQDALGQLKLLADGKLRTDDYRAPVR
jgi:hypothetical protein